MMTSSNGLNLIKQFEGLKLTAYKDPVGIWSIGYGHTKGVKEGDTITREEAERYLRDDLATAEAAVSFYDELYHWNQNEFDALASFAYNIGAGGIRQVTGSGSRDKETIAQKMLLYYNAGGKKLEGLVRRRQAEHDLFVTPVESQKDEKLARLEEFLHEAIDLIRAIAAE